MLLKQATKIAIAVGESLQPFTDRLNIAGSIRRQKPEVKDIEIVCLPKYESHDQGDLFGGVKTEKEISAQFTQLVVGLGTIIKGKPDGRYMQILLLQEINLDLFMPAPWDYYRQYAIRTGSADYAARTIAAAWKRKGWCGSDKGLRLITDCLEILGTDGKSTWRCINAEAERPPVWQSEGEFFEWLGIPLIHPKLRTI